MASFEFDLLGDPIPEGRGKRGRPEHIPTEEKRRLIIVLLAFDWSMEKIAAALNCTPPTLRKHYFRELRHREEARARVEAKLLGKLMAGAEDGKDGAIEKLFKRLEKGDQKQLADRVANRGSVSSAPKLGKKEARKKAAGEVTGKFAPPAAPELLN